MLLLTVVAIALALLAWGGWSSWASWVQTRSIARALNRMAKEQRRQGLVLDNLFKLTLNRVFGKGKAPAASKSLDWNDDFRKTEASGEHERSLTQFDWRKPE